MIRRGRFRAHARPRTTLGKRGAATTKGTMGPEWKCILLSSPTSASQRQRAHVTDKPGIIDSKVTMVYEGLALGPTPSQSSTSRTPWKKSRRSSAPILRSSKRYIRPRMQSPPIPSKTAAIGPHLVWSCGPSTSTTSFVDLGGSHPPLF